MATFRNLSELQRHLENNMIEVLRGSMDIERILAEAVVESVIKNVYEAYEPKEYERRNERGGGGLDDPRNYEISNISLINGKIKLTFENLTLGDDSLKGQLLTDTIEEGIKSNWDDSSGEWSNPRPFMAKASEYLKQNPQELILAVKSGLKSHGFKVK